MVKNIFYFQENVDNIYNVYRKLNIGEIMVFVF